MELGALSRLCELHSSSANESRVRQALALACLSSPSSFVRPGAASSLRRYGQYIVARERRAPPGQLKGMSGKLKIFLFLVEIFLER